MILHFYPDNPVTVLLARRLGRARWRGWEILLPALLAGLLGLLTGDAEGAVLFAFFVFPVVCAIVAPVVHGAAASPLWRDGCLDEVLQTRLSPGEMMDGVAFFTLRKLLPVTLVSGLLFSVCWLLVGREIEPWLVGVLLHLSCPFLAGFVAYATQLAAVGAQRDGAGGWGLVTHLPAAFLCVAAFWLPSQLPYTRWSDAAAFLLCFTLLNAAGVVSSLICRWQAGRASQRSLATGPSAVPVAQTTGNPWHRPWSANPIVVREVSREARSVASGWLGMALARYGAALTVVLLWGGLAVSASSTSGLHGLLYGFALILLLVFLQPFRAASRVSGAVVEERLGGTFDSLTMTEIGSAEFVDGWAQVGWRPRLAESLLVVPLALAVMTYAQHLAGLQVGRPGPAFGVLAVATALLLCLLTYTVAGSYLGLAASALVKSGGQVLFVVLPGMLLAGVIVCVSCDALAPVLGWAVWLWPALTGALLAIALRSLAIWRVKGLGMVG